MSSFMADLNDVASVRGNAAAGVTIKKKGANMDLDMQDFLQLMITQLTNQGIDDSMNTSEMLNQMVQMQMITALANMTDASVMGYAASLVGKTVTVAEYDDRGRLQEIVGTVQGTGMMDGEQVIIMNDKYYALSDILAVGTLPPPKGEDTEKPGEIEKPGGPEEPEEPEEPGGPEEPEGPENPDGPEEPEEPEKPGDTEKPEETENASGTEAAPVYTGEDGVPSDQED